MLSVQCPPPVAHAGDLLLAYACLQGSAPAIAAFRDIYGGVIGRVLRRRKTGAADTADITQTVYERLLVRHPHAEPKLGGYRGHGPLRSWVSIAAATTASTLRRTEGRRRMNEGKYPSTTGMVTAVLSPELSYIKQVYKTEIEQVVEAALDSLEYRSNLLLRLHFCERLSIDQIGAMHNVNRATAARWIASARETLAQAVRASLRQRLNLTDSDYESLVALLRSELDLTIANLFRGRA